MKAATFFIGLAAGAAVGAISALLSTPQTGRELRLNVKSASNDWFEKFSEVKEKVSSLKDSISNLTKEAKEQVPEVVSGLKGSVETWKVETSPIQERLQDEIDSIQSTIEQLEKTFSKPIKKQKTS